MQSNDEGLQGRFLSLHYDQKLIGDTTMAREAMPKYNWESKGRVVESTLCRVPQ